jgi:hypothetical protein
MDRFKTAPDGDLEGAILLVVSGGLSDFIQNTLASIERSGAKNRIYIALPQNALAEVQAAVSRWTNVEYFLLDDICRTDYSWIREYHDFGSEAFNRFTVSKWPAIRFLLKCGFQRVTYTDVDVAWMRNPIPILRAALRVYEMAMQTEGREQFPPLYCTGFMSFRNSEFTIAALDHLEKINLDVVKNNPKKQDQEVFNMVVAGSQGFIHRIFALSELLFPNGLMAEAIASKVIEGKINPIIFHANWTVGIANKRLLLQRTGNWLIDF